MDENNDIALRGVRYAQDQFSEVVTQAEEFVREKPGQSLLIALLAGFILNRLPIGRLFGGVVRLLMFALKPALLIYGATKVYEVIHARISLSIAARLDRVSPYRSVFTPQGREANLPG